MLNGLCQGNMHAQGVLLFLALAVISAQFRIYVVTHSYSSRQFLCTLDTSYWHYSLNLSLNFIYVPVGWVLFSLGPSDRASGHYQPVTHLHTHHNPQHVLFTITHSSEFWIALCYLSDMLLMDKGQLPDCLLCSSSHLPVTPVQLMLTESCDFE